MVSDVVIHSRIVPLFLAIKNVHNNSRRVARWGAMITSSKQNRVRRNIMTIEKIIFNAATCNMGEVTEQDGDNYRAWALKVIKTEYPETEVIVKDSESNTEVFVDGGRCSNESEEEWAACHEFLSSLWEICPWNGPDFE